MNLTGFFPKFAIRPSPLQLRTNEYVHNDTDAFFLFLLQKDFDIFHVIFSKAFLCVFDNGYLSFLYIEKKNYKKTFLLVFW